MTDLDYLRRRVERLEQIIDDRTKVVNLDFKRLHPNAHLPAKAGPDEACYDICCVEDESFLDPHSVVGIDAQISRPFKCLYSGDSHVFHTGLSAHIPRGYAVFLWDRSGMGAKRNIHRLAGMVDASYRGEILVSLINLGKTKQYIEAGDRIIQAYIAVVLPSTVHWVDDLPGSYRGDKGFGSTGA